MNLSIQVVAAVSKKFRCKHEDCIYRAQPDSAEGYINTHACNYFFLTGRSRIAQHPPGRRDPSQCILYMPREGGKVYMNRRTTAPVWEPLAFKMHKQGASDREIAAAVGVSPSTIYVWRVKHGIKSGYVKPKRYASFDTQKALELYKEGKSDREIGEVVGVSRQTVGSWRNGCGLPPIKPGPGVVFQYDWDRALTLYDRGYTDAQIADAIGCKWQTVVKWRRREGLPSKHRF